MVARARQRLAPRGEQVRLWVGDVTCIEAEDATYDAVVDFGIIHHIPDWRAGGASIGSLPSMETTVRCQKKLPPDLRLPYQPGGSRCAIRPSDSRLARKSGWTAAAARSRGP